MNLEELLEQATTNVEKRIDFINALINAEVFVIGTQVSQKNDAGEGIPGVNMFSIKNKDSKDIIPFFSSTEALNLFAAKVATGNPPCVKMRCIDFFKLAISNCAGAVFNLNSQYSKDFSIEEIKALLASLTPGVSVPNSDPDGNVVITLPKTYPEDLIKSLIKFCGSRLDIIKAYVFDITYPKQKPHLLFVIDSEFNKPELFEKIDKVIQEFLTDENDNYDIVSAKEEMCQGFVKKQKPFYSKFGG